MKLSNKEIQPYRIWYEYLQTALNNKSFSNKVNKNYYKDWHLNLVKKQNLINRPQLNRVVDCIELELLQI